MQSAATSASSDLIWYDTIRWTILTCAKKLTNSQLNVHVFFEMGTGKRTPKFRSKAISQDVQQVQLCANGNFTFRWEMAKLYHSIIDILKWSRHFVANDYILKTNNYTNFLHNGHRRLLQIWVKYSNNFNIYAYCIECIFVLYNPRPLPSLKAIYKCVHLFYAK